jgi:hypothetical protein
MSARLKTINAEEAAYEGFRQLAKECDLTSPELVSAMVQYFRVTKADPRTPTGPDLTTSLAKLTAKLTDLDKRTIGFIREQEKTYLKPILAEVQAHKVLSTPAASAPVSVSPEQTDELIRWLVRVLSKGMLPSQLTPGFQRKAPTMGASRGPDDPALTLLKQGLLGVIRVAFLPELMIPTMAPPPAAPAGAPVSHPTQPA